MHGVTVRFPIETVKHFSGGFYPQFYLKRNVIGFITLWECQPMILTTAVSSLSSYATFQIA